MKMINEYFFNELSVEELDEIYGGGVLEDLGYNAKVLCNKIGDAIGDALSYLGSSDYRMSETLMNCI